MEYVEVKNLPAPIQSALTSLNYGRKDIGVYTSPSVCLSSSSGDGLRAFTTLVNLSTAQHETHWGSWGGANMFNPTNPVDLDRNSYALPGDGVAITGHRGGGKPVYAVLHIPMSMVAQIITAAPVELSKVEKDALYCFVGIKGGEYRKEELYRRKVPASIVDNMVERGFLKRNKNGATMATTEGKNALGSYRGF